MSEQMAEGIKCALCPRQCCVDRRNVRGYCGETEQVRVARASLHMWEEPCISGSAGSGTVFLPVVRSDACFARTGQSRSERKEKHSRQNSSQHCFCCCNIRGHITSIW